MLFRVVAAARGHFISTYASTNANQDLARFARRIDIGSPSPMSNASPRFAACRNSERKLSARALVARVLENCLPPTTQRTS